MDHAGEKKLVLTGHSLGGGLAGLLAMQHTKCAVTFNAPGVARSYSNYSLGLESSFMPYQLAVETANSSTLINIRAMFDPVSAGTGPRLGSVESISVPGCRPLGMSSAHVWSSCRWT